MRKIFLITVMIIFGVSFAYAAGDDNFLKLDKNKDGKISQDEYMKAAAATFEKLDKNGDSVLTKEEILSSGNNKEAGELVKTLDLDREGKITRKKYLEAAEKQFKSVDKNHDGLIDVKEWKLNLSPKKTPGLVIFTF